MTIDLDRRVLLPRAEDYPNAERPAEILPVLYGDWTGNGRTPMVPCIQIDTVNGIYTPAAHPVTVEKVWVGEKEADEDDYIINDSSNFDAAGRLITIIRFYDPQEEPISITCTGIEDGTDTLITDPYEARLHFLRNYAGVEDSDLDVGSFSEATTVCEDKGYGFRVRIDRDADIKTLLSEWDQDVMGYYRVRSDGRLRVAVLTADDPDIFGSEAVIDVAKHCVGGIDGAEYIQSIENIVNAVAFDFEYSAVSEKYLRHIEQRSADSVNLYGERLVELELKTAPDATHAAQLGVEMRKIFDGILRDIWICRLRLKSFEWPNLEPFDYIALTDPLGPKVGGGNALANLQFQVLNVTWQRDQIELDTWCLRSRFRFNVIPASSS